ncbi:alpha/beta-hydrolase [Hypoxylon cercidicola]|nr:alpha/beta-hydrolase [Hypoxylon cercidicola]
MADEVRQDRHPHFPILSRLSSAVAVFTLQYLAAPTLWYRDWFHPPEIPPDIVKTYPCRPSLPIRIFFPKSYDPKTSQTLPTLFSIHGGGFCLGRPNDDDVWNARFASMHDMLVIAVNYRKAPAYPFPTAMYDSEAIILAAFEDESLPIDKTRIAIAGFSAGGCLSLGVSQLPSIREKVKPSAALPVYAVVDHSIPEEIKITTRHYKPGLGTGVRAELSDYLTKLSPFFQWSSLSPGFNLKDHRLSPYFAPHDTLPPHIFFVGAELDQLAHETWCMANKMAGRPEPAFTDKVGQEKPSAEMGQLILDDERYAFDHVHEDGKRSVRWLLVPDQVHGFDRLPPEWHGKESLEDAKLKEVAYQEILGKWLREVVWK